MLWRLRANCTSTKILFLISSKASFFFKKNNKLENDSYLGIGFFSQSLLYLISRRVFQNAHLPNLHALVLLLICCNGITGSSCSCVAVLEERDPKINLCSNCCFVVKLCSAKIYFYAAGCDLENIRDCNRHDGPIILGMTGMEQI